MNAVLQNPMQAPVTDGWPDDALPLQAELEAPAPFPMDALPSVLSDYGRVIQRCTQAPDALVGNSLLVTLHPVRRRRSSRHWAAWQRLSRPLIYLIESPNWSKKQNAKS